MTTHKKYNYTSSDMDADIEVREILNLDSHSWTESYEGGDIKDDDYDINNSLTEEEIMRNAPNAHYSPGLVHKRRPKVGDVLRNKQRLQSRRFYGTTGSAKPDSTKSHLSMYDNMSSDGAHSKTPEGNLTPPKDAKINPKKKFLSLHARKKSDSGEGSEINAGLSSTDTQQSSVRYEQVTDRSTSPPSPTAIRRPIYGYSQPALNKMYQRNHIRTSVPNNRSDDVSDSNNDGDDEMANDEIDDVTALAETKPLTSPSRRMSSPILEYGARRGSLLSRNNSQGFVPKSGHSSSTVEAPRLHGVIPRMGLAPTSPGSSMSTANNNGIYKAQGSQSCLAAQRLASQDPIMTTLKPTHEVSESTMWNFRGNTEPRPTFAYNGNAAPHLQATTPNDEDTTARFMNKRPSIMVAYNGRHIRDSRQFDTKSMKSKMHTVCNWKCSAILFMLISAILFGLASFFMVQSIRKESIASTECLIGSNSQQTIKEEINPGGEASKDNREFLLGHKASETIAPGAFWVNHAAVLGDQHVKFNFSIHKRAIIGVYGRRGVQPTHTKYDFFEVLDGNALPTTLRSSSRDRRSMSSEQTVNVNFVQYLFAGTWHFGIFNDGDTDEEVEFVAKMTDGMTSCSNNCGNNGDCVKGVCKCFPGFQGLDCSQVSCPVVCNGRGLYAHGACVCFSGWKGADCSTPSNKCIVPDCSGHGSCNSNGECVCVSGFKGNDCSLVDCVDPTCSGHGICFKGICRCDSGWGGETCKKELSPGCFEPCNNQGRLDPNTKQCICNAGWSGSSCSIASTSPSAALCIPKCHEEHGVCVNGKCKCNSGWTGRSCEQKMCDERCYKHGSCNNGICQCEMGWNGDLCTIDGCPGDCSSHGHCAFDNGIWSCRCNLGWKGEKCNIESETKCGDGRDNDRDTLIDCNDPDCCSQSSCMWGNLCQGAKDPVTTLKQIRARNPLPATASFYDKTKFLIESKNGLQQNAIIAAFKPEQASVVRGMVETMDGSPIVGAQVNVYLRTKMGTVRTGSSGWFTMLINGGGSFLLQVAHNSFQSETITVFVPRNEIVVAPTCVMQTSAQPRPAPEACDLSKFSFPDAAILPSSRSKSQGCETNTNIVPETQSVHESIELPYTESNLVYLSSRVYDFQSVIEVQLTSSTIPGNLKNIQLVITILGSVFKKIFEPNPDLRYIYTWNRKDVFNQDVYGRVNAKIEVGALYTTCDRTAWETYYTEIYGHDPSLKYSIGNWSIDMHHTYLPQTSTVYFGNGNLMEIGRYPPLIDTYMGTGSQRREYCDQCNGPAIEKSLLAPVALASDMEGNVYVADYNYIRKIDNQQNVSSLLYLRKPPHRYYIAASPREGGSLYYSDPNDRHVYKIRNMNLKPRPGRTSISQTDLSGNKLLIAGIGSLCLPLAKDKCGEGGPATLALLSNPRGITLDEDEVLYIVDGPHIKFINSTNNIYTLTGSNNLARSRPLPCKGRISFDQVQFEYPTELTYSAHYKSLFVLDLNVVIQLHLRTRQVSLAAGTPVHCLQHAQENPDRRDSRKISLVSPNAITLSQKDGSLYISETNEESIHRVRRVDVTNHRISTVAGSEAGCDCQLPGCNCYLGDNDFAKNARLNTPVALTTTPDGSLFIADQLNQRIRKVFAVLPKKNDDDQYRITNGGSNEVYLFAADGHLISTQNAITETVMYNFSRSSDGELSSITDINGNRLAIIRDADDIPTKILLPNRQLLHLQMTEANVLSKVTIEGSSVSLMSAEYTSDDSALLHSITKQRTSSYFFSYDSLGRVVSAITGDGRFITLHLSLNASRNVVTMETTATGSGGKTNLVVYGSRSIIIETDQGFLSDIIRIREGQMETTYERWSENSISVKYLDGSEMNLQMKPHNALGLSTPYIARRSIQLASDPLENNIEWKFRQRRERNSRKYIISRHMFVNGRNILTLDYSRETKQCRIYDDHTKFVLKVFYDEKGQPYQWSSTGGTTFANLTYDRSGHATVWNRGQQTEQLWFDVSGNILKRQTSSEGTWAYTNDNKVTSVTPPGSTSGYRFAFDEQNDLRHLTSPTGIIYTITSTRCVGFIRVKVAMENLDEWFVQDFDDNGKLLMQNYPGVDRRVVFRFDSHSRVSQVLHDKTDDRNLRDPESGELLSMATSDCVIRFEKNGPLTKRMMITPQSRNGMQAPLDSVAVFEYEYDSNLRKSMLRAKINETVLSEESFAYHDVSGKERLFGDYSAIHYSNNMYVISTKSLTYTKESNANGRPTQIKCNVYRNPVALFMVEYDNGDRVSYQKHRIGAYNNETEYEYKYHTMGMLREVIVDRLYRWRYSYDRDGKLIAIQKPKSRLVEKLKYNLLGRITMRGKVQYIYDADGFLSKRGSELFEYDSLGHLVMAQNVDRLNSYKILYGYDGYGRLSSRFNTIKKELIRFYYTDPKQPTLLTHAYNSTHGQTAEITIMRYDLEGKLFAIERSGQTWPVICDAVGTPIAMFDTSGFLIKSMRYSPFGEVVFDSAPELSVAIGYKGGIYDPTTKLVHFPMRRQIQSLETIGIENVNDQPEFNLFSGVDYDPNIGQVTTPDLSLLLMKTTPIVPYLPYQITDPVNPTKVESHMTNVKSWLGELGFSFENVAPKTRIVDRQSNKASIQCQLQKQFDSYLSLKTEQRSALIPKLNEQRNPMPDKPMFAEGFVMSIDGGVVSTHVVKTSTDDIKRLSGLLNGANVIFGNMADSQSGAMSLTIKGKPVIYLWKKMKYMPTDKVSLRMSSAERMLSSGFETIENFGSARPSSSENLKASYIRVNVDENRLNIASSDAIIIVCYIDNNHDALAEEKNKIIAEVEKQATADAWKYEREKIKSNYPTTWDSGEKQSLSTQGSLYWYDIEPVWDPEKYPEFLSSWRNRRFVRKRT